MMTVDLSGRVAIVTGAGGGLAASGLADAIVPLLPPLLLPLLAPPPLPLLPPPPLGLVAPGPSDGPVPVIQ